MSRYIDVDELLENMRRHKQHSVPVEYIKSLTPAHVVPVPKWISVKERMPESGEVCLLACKRTYCYSEKTYRYVCDGFYAERWKEEVAHDGSENLDIEYNEETDEYCLCEGWYERIHNWADWGGVVISDTVTHWMPLPEPPKEEGEPT